MDSPEKRPTGGHPPVVDRIRDEDFADRSSDIFFAAVETTRMPMIVADARAADAPIIFVNPAFQAMTGYTRNEIVGRNCRFLQGPDTDRGSIAQLRKAIARKEQFATEILNYRKDGSTFWNALFVSPVYNKAGEVVYFFGSQLDVSRRRDAEEALRQAQKMEALGQLTGGIAHDFNNLLQVISGYTDVIESVAGKPQMNPDRLLRASQNIRAAADRASTLTHQLLAFARKQRLEGRLLNANDLIESLRRLAERPLGDDIVLKTDLASGLWTTRLDSTQAEVALLNIVINARDAMPDGGTLTVSTRNVSSDDAVLSSAGLRPGRYVEIALSDTGAGMSPEILARVTEPFFTTKEEGKGTGLGLSMVYGFAKQSGGGVVIESQPGCGTTVRLLFPAVEGEIELDSRRLGRPTDKRGTESILIVDDRPDVAEIASVMLEDFGYRTTVVQSARDALDRLGHDGAGFDLLLSDIIMPGGMNGIVLAREARERYPAMKILLTTGFVNDPLNRDAQDTSEFEVISKPYRRNELARRVRLILDGSKDNS